jgi:hypothetical protein
MAHADGPRLHAFARTLVEEDLQFLRVDITGMRVVVLWGQNIKAGRTLTVPAEKDRDIVGYASPHNNHVS